MEAEILKPMWHEGKPLEPGAEGESNPVIDLPESDLVYLESIGRVRRIPQTEATKATEVKDPKKKARSND